MPSINSGNFEPTVFILQANTERKTNERAKGPKAWIREGTEEEPVDFLDPGVVQRVVGKLFPHKSFENQLLLGVVTVDRRRRRCICLFELYFHIVWVLVLAAGKIHQTVYRKVRCSRI